MKNYLLLILGIWLFGIQAGHAQKATVKTNLLSDITTTFNLGTEIALDPKWTLDLSAGYNPWTFADNKKWKHWIVQPELRYWLCEKFNGHFFGVHLHGGQYNAGNIDTSIKFLGTDFSPLKSNRFEGWFAGAGIGYGYSWILGRHWNLEAEIGIGYAYSRFDKFDCSKCGEKLESGKSHHYVGPTKTAVNLIYVF